MFFGPIITLDLVTSARRVRYFILRVVYALILLFLLWMNYSTTRWGYGDTASIRQVAAFSEAFFITFSIAQLVAIVLLTPAMIAGCIAQERERKTIEYLFSSTLTNGEIVLSKFIARTVHVATILAVGLPVLALTMMLGGVEPELLLMIFLVTLATLIGVAALSIASSVWAKRGRDAVVRTYVLLLAFFVFPLLMMLLAELLSGAWNYDVTWLMTWAMYLAVADPFYVMFMLVEQRFSGPGASMWELVGYYVAAYLGFTFLIMTWSTLSIRRVYRKSVGVGAGPKRGARWFAELRRRPAIGAQPMIWKEMFAETAAINLGRSGRVIIALLFAASVAWPYCMLFDTFSYGGRLREDVAEYTLIMTPILLHAALLIIMVRAAGSITAERERDSWLTLISTPMSGAEIVWGKIAGSLYSARWFLVPLGLLWLLTGFLWPETLLIVPVLAGIFMCVALAVATTGVWFSCWCATSIRAIASSVGVAIFVGGGYMLCCGTVIAFASMQGGGDESMILSMSLCIPVVLGAPGGMWLASLENPGHNSMGREGGYFVTAVVIGTIAYFFIGMLMASATIANFDALVGRTNRMQDPLPRGPRPAPRPLAPGPILSGPTAPEPQA